ncbi:MAG: hypothetical protein JXA99_06465 [Candidatus Lokiarchaeota archaeon]|nr:hypothetical protein [Candidatus Lokiarchaeota archaeon]
MSNIQSQLEDHLANAKEWEKMETPVPGVFVVKAPGTKTKPALLYLEINPLKEDGNPMKRKGLFIGSNEMYVKFYEALADDRVQRLVKEIEEINPEQSSSKTKKLKM